jgi:hypothetical protein
MKEIEVASSKWKTYEELNETLKNRKFIFWGATNWIERTLEGLNNKPIFIVDKSELNQGVMYNGYQVKAPEKLKFLDNPFVIIATANYMSVIEDLEKLNFVMGEDYCCSPLLNQKKDKDDLLNHHQSLLISSPQHFSDSKRGGGLYKVNLKPFEIEKVYTGKARGISKYNNRYYVIDILRGVVVLDKNYKEIDIIKLEKNSEPHGIFVDEASKLIYIGTPGRDSVSVYSISTKEKINEYFVSNKWSINKKDNHHVNDPFIYGNSLYISMFSFSGNWMNEVYDGGILEIDLKSGKILGPVFSDKWMPHSITRINGKLTFLNSMLGELYHASYGMICKTNGFARGLAHDGRYFYIGTTEHRYPEKLKNISNNISLDTGFYVFDEKSSLTKFYSMPDIEAIHSIVITLYRRK